MLEAEHAIMALAKLVPPEFDVKKKRIGRQRAQELGTAGKRGRKPVSTVEVMAGPEELKHIYNLMQRIGWAGRSSGARTFTRWPMQTASAGR